MAVSSTKEKLGKLLINLAIKRFETWSQKQFIDITADPKPFCLEINNNHYVIGNFHIKIQSDKTAIVHNDGRFVHHFQNKAVAIYYCAYEKLQKYANANRLLQVDAQLTFARADYEMLSARLKTIKKVDDFQRNVYFARYQEAFYKLKTARAEFQKTLTTHKYNKIWDTLL